MSEMTWPLFHKNESGVWCNFCCELVFAPWFDEYDDETQWPGCCPECGMENDDA